MRAASSMMVVAVICGLAACAAVAAEAGPSQAPAAPPAAAQEKPVAVTMPGLKYSPAKVVIKVGQTVEWKNTSKIAHTVTADPKLAKRKESVLLPKDAKPFNSGTMQGNAVFRYTFTVPGLYRYFCIPHEMMGMVGEVEVKP
jgi:plastocyanin